MPRKKVDPTALTLFDQLADEFVDEISDKHPLCHDGEIYFYDGNKYCLMLEEELENYFRHWLRKKGLGQKNHTVKNTIPIIYAMPGIYNGELNFKKQTMPYWRNPKDMPDPRNLIPLVNGLLNLDGFNLVEHTPNFCCDYCLDFDFDAKATCPCWLKFLDEVYEGDIGKKNLLQEWMGYCLTRDTRFQKLLMLVGVKRGGKGTILRVFEKLMGKNAVGFDLNDLARPYGTAKLVNALVAIVGEIELNANHKRLIIQCMNSIVGEDCVSIEKKYRDGTSAKLPVRFMLAANEPPAYADSAGAMPSRTLMLQHEKSFEAEADKELDTKLASEMTGIINWAVEGLVRLRTNQQFDETSSVEHVKNFQTSGNPRLWEFIQDHLILHSCCNNGQRFPVEIEFNDKPQSCSRQDLYARLHNTMGLDRGQIDWLLRDLNTVFPGKIKYYRKRSLYENIGLRTMLPPTLVQ
ncbi:MAG: hypothetical protein KGZ39_05610 [Simkania sp.]|nr:hypothetical protein [Simkania sp.]